MLRAAEGKFSELDTLGQASGIWLFLNINDLSYQRTTTREVVIRPLDDPKWVSIKPYFLKAKICKMSFFRFECLILARVGFLPGYIIQRNKPESRGICENPEIFRSSRK